MSGMILYLRTDLVYQDFHSGGSVGHTLGVINGFIDNGFEVVCITTCLYPLIKKLHIKALQFVGEPPFLLRIKWPLGCFLQSWMIIFAGIKFFKTYKIEVIYQRSSILNFSGIILSWWYNKPLILEYNGSDVWMMKHWNKEHCKKFLLPFISFFEMRNLYNADYIVVISKVLKNDLIKRGVKENKILVNPNGVDVELFDPEFTSIKNFTCVKQL